MLPGISPGHPFCFAFDSPVVVVIDVFGDGSLQLLKRPELAFVAVEHLPFRGSKEPTTPAATPLLAPVAEHQ